MCKPPVQVVILFHPESEVPRRLAKAMYRYLADDGTGRLDLRIPVVYGPDRGDGRPPDNLDFDRAEHTVVAVFVDARMARRVDGGTAEQWGDFLAEALRRCPTGASPHHVLPVALDGKAFDLDDRLEKTSFVRLDILPPDDEKRRSEELAFQITVRALYLLQNRPLPTDVSTATRPKAPVELFLSHAKTDLPKLDEVPPEQRSGPVYSLLSYLAASPVNGWYDAKKIPPGRRFNEEIEDGVLKSSALVCVLTDRYATREWCRREVLAAKRAGRPMVVVDALENGETRNFPYLGNVPTIRWRGEPQDARSVVGLAVREALRYQQNVAVLEARKQSGDIVLGAPPELLTVGLLAGERKRIIYPDPPLGREELELFESIAKGVTFLTPLSEVISQTKKHPFDMLGLSLSDSTDIRRYGVDSEHLTTLADDLCLFLLLAGLKLAYGGRIGHDGEQVDDVNFTVRLFGLVRSYSPLAKEIGGKLAPIVNYVGWPIYQRYGDKELNLYGREAELRKVGPPDPLGVPLDKVAPDAQGWFPADTAPRRFAWARAMTAMRERMTAEIGARVVMGGKLEKYSGVYPGVLEEALLMLRAKKPLYLIGAFGGAARLVIDVLEDVPREELTTEWVRKHVPDFDATVALYKDAQLDCPAPEQIRDELRAFRDQGLKTALANGLDDTENRSLFHATDPRSMVELILHGLSQLDN